MQSSALCLLLCFCVVEEHKLKWEEKIKGNTFLLFTLFRVCKNTLCFYGMPQRFVAKATSGTFHHLQRACWGSQCLVLVVAGDQTCWIFLSLCIPVHLFAAFLGSAPGTSLRQTWWVCNSLNLPEWGFLWCPSFPLFHAPAYTGPPAGGVRWWNVVLPLLSLSPSQAEKKQRLILITETWMSN